MDNFEAFDFIVWTIAVAIAAGIVVLSYIRTRRKKEEPTTPPSSGGSKKDHGGPKKDIHVE